MKFPLILRLVLAACASLAVPLSAAAAAAESVIQGAGSSAAAPVYRIWAEEYLRDQGDRLAYDPAGSGAGMKRISQRTVDFGASDFYATPDFLHRFDLVMVPTVITGVVPVVNLPHVGPNALRLTGPVLAGIFLGEIRRWDAPEIRALNPGLDLPAHAIHLVVRSDGSGTTYHFSAYLGQVSPAWKQRRGTAALFDKWPASTQAVQGSSGVSQAVRDTPDSIGYVDYNYIVDDDLAGVQMKNADGQYVSAGVDGFRAAALHSTWYRTGDFSTEISELPGAASWPITMGTYVAVPRVTHQPERTERALRFITWGYLHGDALARRALFVPLPEKVQASAWREIARVSDTHGTLIGARLIGKLVK